MSKPIPSIDAWLKEAKAHETAPLCGMYLTHNGTVRQTAKAKVRYGAEATKEVTGMIFSYDEEKVTPSLPIPIKWRVSIISRSGLTKAS